MKDYKNALVSPINNEGKFDSDGGHICFNFFLNVQSGRRNKHLNNGASTQIRVSTTNYVLCKYNNNFLLCKSTTR